MCAPLPAPEPVRRDLTNPVVLIRPTLLCLAFLYGAASAEETALKSASTAAPPVVQAVRTTAYTHSESDHLKYGARTAVGTPLRHGAVRSAAALGSRPA